MSLLVALVFAASPALAVDREDAEHQRLSSEISQLATRQSWPGVEKKWAELEKLGVEPTFDDLMKAAYAARALGNVADAYARLKRAAKIDGTKEIVDWLYTIDANYGHVELVATPPKNVELTITELPFDPDARIAVQAATEHVKTLGGFNGLLPKGSYSFAGAAFSVVPGVSVRIEVSPRLKKTQGEVVNMTTTATWGSGTEEPPATTAPPTEPPPSEPPPTEPPPQ